MRVSLEAMDRDHEEEVGGKQENKLEEDCQDASCTRDSDIKFWNALSFKGF